MSPCRLIIAAAAILITAFSTLGHQSPDHVVEALTKRINTEGPTARVLMDRAYEHQSLGNWDAVLADFKAALELEPRSRAALMGCVEALLKLDALTEAESMARRGLVLDEDLAGKSPFYALQGRILSRKHNWLEALAAWRGALQSPQPEIDWFLGEAECLERLDRQDERAEALFRASQRNPSIVLRRTWIRALVDAGDFEAASPEIEHGISQARWLSSWLLLRARIHAQRQLYDEQRVDAADALTEIRSRLSFEHPDPHLVAEAAQALAFLGEKDEALRYLAKARNLGISESHLMTVKRVIDTVSASPSPNT